MSFDMVDKIARAVLYEGYLLYPYRQSALKNQQRWNFGVLYPPAFSATQTGSDRSYFQMECLTTSAENARIDVSVRFLRLVARGAGEHVWQEAIEQKISLDALSVAELAACPRLEKFSLAAGEEADAQVIRRKFPIQGEVEVSAIRIRPQLFRLTVRVRNTIGTPATHRNDALLHSLASAHAVLHIHDGEFISQIDPPEEFSEAAARCQNTGVWPVLVGESGIRDTMIGSPIILYDYPQVAPESKGDLFDATEIDEILILRILTLTHEEKEEIRRSDERARLILERLEASPPEHLLELHGTIRGMRQPQADPWSAIGQSDAWSAWDTLEGKPAPSALVSGVELKKGDRVRLRPQKRADIFDTLLQGQVAIIEAVEEDFEGNIHFAVVLEDDPGKDLGEMRQAGHRFFFSREEVEPIGSSSAPTERT
jgi:hypothetical protein